MAPYLEMRNISKSFFGNQVLCDVSISLELGKVYSLVGENGAGKSTLMKILCGSLTPDAGQVIIDDREREIKTPLQGIQNGISMIYQELNPIPEMTIAENIFLGREDTRWGLIDYGALTRKTQKLLNDLDMPFRAGDFLRKFKVSDLQLIEICKAISYNSSIIIMDEPTSSLSSKEIERLYRVTDDLRRTGKTIIFISHKFDEIFRVSDEVFVLRDGVLVGRNIPIRDIEPRRLVALMVGRELEDIYPERQFIPRDVALEVKNLTSEKVRQVSFTLYKGEILGVAGLVGAGRTEMAEALFGLAGNVCGEVFIDGRPVCIQSPADAIRHKMAFVTEDRKRQGLFLGAPIRENISISSLDQLLHFRLLSPRKEAVSIREKMKSLRVKAIGPEQRVQSLSGGNQQKIVLAKWLMTLPSVLILDEPTRGIDIGAKMEIYKLIDQLTRDGCAILLISSELSEIIGLSDRVLCYRNFGIVGELCGGSICEESIMALATGVEETVASGRSA